jgi:2-polyprenyl-3-methyl-5-hydroxy-6-metoxy-1,4-benzoquinol methylase
VKLDISGLTSAEQAEVSAYLRYHRRRFRLLCDLVAARAPRRVLDVGPNLQTLMLREELPGAAIDTLGFAHPLTAPRDAERHREIDLNEAARGRTEPGTGEHDVVVLAEVIEHLHAPPAHVLGYLAGWLRPGGALIVQTPNAVALHKRLRMLAGRSPFEPIRDSDENPGHFHEYTATELAAVGRDAGLEVEDVLAANYFGEGGAYAALGRVLPRSLRHGITATFCKPARRDT